MSQAIENPLRGPAAASRAYTVGMRIDVGKRWLTTQQAAALKVGSVIELDASSEADVEATVQGRPLARGPMVVVDGKLAMRVKELM